MQRSRNQKFWSRKRRRRSLNLKNSVGTNERGNADVIRLFAEQQSSENSLKSWSLKLADIAMHIIHSGLILFSMVGFMWDVARPWHLLAQFLIFTSWYGLGQFFYPGYCVLTDLHWKLKRVRGCEPKASYYTKHVIDSVFGSDVSHKTLDVVSNAILFSAILISVVWNCYDWWTGNLHF